MSNEIVQTIPDFKAEDYETSKPFEWLYQFKDNKFVLQQMCQKMKAKAGAVGVKSFMTLWNAYLESAQQSQGIKTQNATNFDGQPLELESGEYLCNDRGVYTLDRFGYETVICRHAIEPIRRLVNIDSGEERLEIAFKKGRSWRSIIVEKTTIASASQILQLASVGIMVNADNAKALSTYLLDMEQFNYDTLPEEKSVGRLGWVLANGFSPYVDGLVFDGEMSFKHIFNAVKPTGSAEKWIDAMKKVRAEKTTARLFLAASFASAILEPCGLLPFFLHAWGGTGVGKSVGLMIAASVWANPRGGEYTTTFNATNVGQEMVASFLNSMPMCIDELQIQSSAGVKDFDKTIYQLTEGVGRTRGAKFGGLQKQTTWRNCFITNGEQPITNSRSAGGAVNRIIEIECKEPIYSDLVGLCAILNENYGWAGKEFVQRLQMPGALEAVNKLQKAYYKALLHSESTEKQAASASALLTADQLATKMFFNDGNELKIEDIKEIMASKEGVNVNERALEFLYELVAANPSKFPHQSDGDKYSPDNYIPVGEVWGKISGEYTYIIKSIFDRELLAAGFNSESFLSWASRNNKVLSNSGRRTRRARIGSSIVNAVCLVQKNAENEEIPSNFTFLQEEIDF